MQGKKPVAIEMVDVLFIYQQRPGARSKIRRKFNTGNEKKVRFEEMEIPGGLRLPDGINSGEQRHNGEPKV